MKKVVLLVILISLITGMGTALFAQSQFTTFPESDYYYFQFPIEKIYIHSLGYLVLYRRNSNFIGRSFIPQEWFRGFSDKGEIVYLSSGKEWPSMTVYFKDGEFSHVRLRLRRSRAHETWAIVPSNMNINEYFKDIEELDFIF